MSEIDGLELVQGAIWTVFMVTAPAVSAAMIVGIVIALLQALTQVQETTLTFVPKIMAIMFVTLTAAPIVGGSIVTFAQVTMLRIEKGF